MKNSLIADRYARGLSEVLEDGPALESALECLRDFSTIVSENPELGRVIANPAIAAEKRVAILDAILDRSEAAPLLRNLVATLVRRGRITLLSNVTERFSHYVDERLGRVSAQVDSAVALSEAQCENIAASLEKFSGKRVRIEYAVKPALMGGVIARIGGTVIDGSIRTRIERLKQSLLSEENLGG